MGRFQTCNRVVSGRMKSDSYLHQARLKFFAVSVCWGFLLACDTGLASTETDQRSAEKVSPQLIEAQNFLSKHQYAEAEKSFKEALASTPPSDSKNVIDLLNYIGATLHAQRKEKEAIDYFSKALAALPQKITAGDLRKAKILSNLSLVLSAQGNTAKAMECAEEALSTFHAQKASPLDLAVLLNSYGRQKMEAGDLKRAESLFAEAVAVREKITGSNSIELVSPLVNLSGAYLEQRNLAQAERTCRRAIAICQQQNSAANKMLFPLLLNLAGLHVEQHQYKEAIITYKRAEEIAERYFGKNSEESLATYYALSESYEKDGQTKLSERSLTRALEICRLLYGQKDKETIDTTLALAHLFHMHGNSAEAERLRLLCRLTQRK